MKYKDLHLDRGETYDATLSSSPFDTYMSEWETKHVADIVRQEYVGGIGRYLDFACGTGRITQVIADSAREVVGVDISASMLDVARVKLPRAQFLQADLTSERLDLGQFDLVSSFRFFGNAEPCLRQSALRALNPLLKMGGHLLVNNHRNPLACLSLIDRLGSRTMRVDLTHRRFCGILGTAGFEVIRTQPIGVWHFRNSIAARAGSNPRREAQLERFFSSRLWATVAPDAVILARKIKDR